MSNRIIETSNIDSWASVPANWSLFPEYVYRLIRETCDDIVSIRIPTEAGVSLPDFDGILETRKGFKPYVPGGKSVWEIGCDKDPKRKFKKEWQKRKDQGLNHSELVFVFVTPRHFPKSKVWIEQYKVNSPYKDIVLIDRTLILQWLDDAPVTSLFFQKDLGIPNEGLRSAGQYFSEVTRLKIGPQTILGGREKNSKEIIKRIESNISFVVESFSIEESILFVIASIKTKLEKNYLFKVVVCLNKQALEYMLLCKKPHTIIVPLDNQNDIDFNLKQQGHFIIRVDHYDSLFRSSPDNIILDKYKSYAVATGLEKEANIPSDVAETITNAGQGIFHKLKRYLFENSSNPAWIKKISAETYIPAILIGEWQDGDGWQSEYFKVLGVDSVKKFNLSLVKFCGAGDEFTYSFRNLWKVKDLVECYSFYYKDIQPDQLLAFQRYAIATLTYLQDGTPLKENGLKSALLLKENEKVKNYAINGVVRILIAIQYLTGNDISTRDLKTIKKNILSNYFEFILDKQFTVKFNNIHRFAEAAPELFLEFIEEVIQDHPDIINELFSDNENYNPFPSGNQAGLLWALEGVADVTEYFDRVVDALLALCKYDGLNNSSNNALSSLSSILSFRYKKSDNYLDHLSAIIRVLKENPKQYLEFLIGIIIPVRRKMFYPKHSFRKFRNIKKQSDNLIYSEYYDAVEKILPSAIDASKVLEEQTLFILLNHLQPKLRIKLLDLMIKKSDELKMDTDFWIRLMYYKDSNGTQRFDKSFMEEELSRLNELEEFCVINGSSDLANWLFTTEAHDILGYQLEFHKVKDYKKIEIELSKKRIDYLEKLYRKDIKELINFSLTTKEPLYIYQQISYLNLGIVDGADIVSSAFESSDTTILIAVKSFIGLTSRKNGFEWVKSIYDILMTNKKEMEMILFLLLNSSVSKDLWAFIDEVDLGEKYWISFKRHLDFEKIELNKEGIDHLFRVHRYAFGLSSLGYNLNSYSADYLLGLLEDVDFDKSIDKLSDSNLIERLFKNINEDISLSVDRKAQQEFRFSSILLRGFLGNSLPNLSQLIYKQPVELVNLLNQAKSEQDPTDKFNHIQVLDNLIGFPGYELESIDEPMILKWTELARSLANESDLSEEVDFVIGGVLSRVPFNDEIPKEFVCVLVSEINTKHLIDGFTKRGQHLGGGLQMISDNNISLFKEKYEKIKSASRKIKSEYPVIYKILTRWSNEEKSTFDNWGDRSEFSNETDWIN